MRKPKPKLSTYLKTRFKHPLKLSYNLIYIDDLGNRYHEDFSAHTAIINLTAAGLSLVTLIRLNCTLWYLLSCIFVLFILKYLRYFWADFRMLDDNNKPTDTIDTMSIWQRIFFAIEVLLMISIVIGVTIISNASPYARVDNYLLNTINDSELEIGETYKYSIEQKPDSLLKAYEASAEFAQTRAWNGIITHYGAAVFPKGTIYFLSSKIKVPLFS